MENAPRMQMPECQKRFESINILNIASDGLEVHQTTASQTLILVQSRDGAGVLAHAIGMKGVPVPVGLRMILKACGGLKIGAGPRDLGSDLSINGYPTGFRLSKEYTNVTTEDLAISMGGASRILIVAVSGVGSGTSTFYYPQAHSFIRPPDRELTLAGDIYNYLPPESGLSPIIFRPNSYMVAWIIPPVTTDSGSSGLEQTILALPWLARWLDSL